jgi:hypothetical protein
MMQRGMVILLYYIVAVVGAANVQRAIAQELYPNSEAASNSPKDVLRLRAMTTLQNNDLFTAAKALYSVTSDLMLAGTVNVSSRLGLTASESFLTTPVFRSASLYGKMRLYNDDKPHQHLRFAAFGEYDVAPNGVSFETYMMGIKNGATLGGIGTILLNKTAVSLTASWFTPMPVGVNRLQSNIVNYSLSVGQLVLPVKYRTYTEPNLNIYCELLGFIFDGTVHEYVSTTNSASNDELHSQYSRRFHQLDLAPSAQLIVDSRAKIDFTVRVSLLNVHPSQRGWMAMLALEYYFFE